MNSNILYGIIAFLVWSAFCSWHYTCNIKGLCFGAEPSSMEQTIEPITSTSKAQADLAKPKSDSTIVQQKIEIPPVNITEDKISFLINSSEFSNPEYANKFILGLKNKIENKHVDIKIEGYTCDLGSELTNQKLGLERATAMKSLLIQNDISGSIIEIVSRGEITSNENTNEERQRNRKVIITIKSTEQ